MSETFARLGNKSNLFYSPITRFKLVGKEVKKLPDNYQKDGNILRALSGGHIRYASDAEVENFKKATSVQEVEDKSKELEDKAKEVEELKESLQKVASRNSELEALASTQGKRLELLKRGLTDVFSMDKKELTKYITENYELTAEEEKEFKAKSLEDKQAYAYELEMASVSE